MRLIGSPETSVSNHLMPRNSPEAERINFNRSASKFTHVFFCFTSFYLNFTRLKNSVDMKQLFINCFPLCVLSVFAELLKAAINFVYESKRFVTVSTTARPIQIRYKSSDTLRRVAWELATNVSKQRAAFIFRVNQSKSVDCWDLILPVDTA